MFLPRLRDQPDNLEGIRDAAGREHLFNRPVDLALKLEFRTPKSETNSNAGMEKIGKSSRHYLIGSLAIQPLFRMWSFGFRIWTDGMICRIFVILP